MKVLLFLLSLYLLYPDASCHDPDTYSAIKAFLYKVIYTSNQVIVFSKTYCPYSQLAKRVLRESDIEFTAYELDKMPDTDTAMYQDVLSEISARRTVPQVYANGKFIGGGTDVEKLAEIGELKKICQGDNYNEDS